MLETPSLRLFDLSMSVTMDGWHRVDLDRRSAGGSLLNQLLTAWHVSYS